MKNKQFKANSINSEINFSTPLLASLTIISTMFSFLVIELDVNVGLLNSSKVVLSLLCAFAILSSLFLSYHSKKKYLNSPNKKEKIYNSLSFATISLLLILLIVTTNFDIYLNSQPDRKLTYTSWQTLALTIFLVATCVRRISIYANILLSFAMLLYISYLASFLVIWNMHPYNQNALNLSVVFNPIIQNIFGSGVQIDFRSQYGMYPEFISPLFQLISKTDGASLVHHISVAFSLLFLISYLSVFIFLQLLIRRKILVFIGMSALIYLHLFALTLWPYELYYQYYPIRILFPMLSLSLIYFLLKKVGSRQRMFVVFFILTLGVFWNLDVGLPTLISMYFVYVLVRIDDSSAKSDLKVHIKDHFMKNALDRNLYYPILVIILSSGAFILYLRIKYGEWIDPDFFFLSQRLFLGGGTLPGDGIWRALFLLSFISFTYWFLVRRQKGLVAYVGIFVNVLNFGLLTYFVNNTHPSTLANTWWPYAILATIHLDDVLVKAKTRVKKHNDVRTTLPIKIFQWPISIEKAIVSTFLAFSLSFFAAAGFLNLKNSQILKDQISFFDYYLKGQSERALFAFPERSQDSTEIDESKVDYISLNEQKRLQIIPPWEEKRRILASLKSNGNFNHGRILALSSWDYLLYAELNRSSGLIAPNFYHTFTENEWKQLFQVMKNDESMKFVILDRQYGLFEGSVMAHPTEKVQQIVQILDDKFELRNSYFVGWTWYLDKYQKNYLEVWIRKP